MISRPKDVSNFYSFSYKYLLEYVGLLIIKQWYHGEHALKKTFKIIFFYFGFIYKTVKRDILSESAYL